MKLWRRLFAAFALAIAVCSASAAEVAIIAHEPGYYTSLARHLERWLKGNGIASEVASVNAMAAPLTRAKLAFLVGFVEPSAAEMKQLRAFRSRGGKLVVFHSASPALADLMGVKPLGYATARYPGQWSRMDFSARFPEGLPASVQQTSTVLQKAVPLPGKGSVVAVWCDRTGRPTGDAAWIATSGGWWMTHVLLADGDEDLKAQLVSALVGAVVPKLWNAASHHAQTAARERELAAFAAAQRPCPGEIRAVWDHSGCGLFPGDWGRTMRLLKAAHVSDLFVNVAGAGFAHYPSRILPRSKICLQEGDQLRACVAAAKREGIRVHAWILCFSATRSTPELLKEYERRGWRLKTTDGRLSEYLDPSNAQVQSLILQVIDEIQANYQVGGIHLDFVRWYERSNRPKNAAASVSRFVALARQHVRRPRWLTAAVLGKYPSCVASVGQDWTSWVASNLVDYVVPMDYTENNALFESFLRQHAASHSLARRTIVGIGVTANESRLDARQVIGQINLVRKYGLAGVALFDLDVTLQRQILPYLVKGVWK